jgi:lipopolysaccharide/colanic/teichoic acid biosynthesis glycosyltransferase
MYIKFFKRIFDFSAALIGLLILSLIILIISVLIRIKLGNPIFFRQKRPGLNKKPFEIIKFRTLTNEKDSNDNFLSEEERLTKFGAFLRSTSMDEFPELINVLMGDMSLVGPRPLRMYYLPLYNDFQNRRHEVRPGITGWAQINGRNNLSWEQKFELDVWYVDNISFCLDMKILFTTCLKVFKKENTTPAHGNFTKPFKGTGINMISDEEIEMLKQKDNL